jgi:hypothetical protein
MEVGQKDHGFSSICIFSRWRVLGRECYCVCVTLETGLQWEVKIQPVIYTSLNLFLLRHLLNDSYEQCS